MNLLTSTHDRTIIFAGFATTATSLTWLLLEVARHPHVQIKLRQEIHEMERKVQSRGDSEFTAADFESMPYLNAVLKVSLSSNPGFISSDLIIQIGGASCRERV